MARPRVLLVEDDASIRRFVALALEDLPIELLSVDSLAAAIQALRGGAFVMVLCDLMLPDGSGEDLLRSLAEPDSPSPQARRVAFSAGISAQVRQRLDEAGVHEILTKPVALATLSDCVQRALAVADADADTDAAVAGGAAAAGAVDPARAEAVARYFGGSHDLYDLFIAQCRLQWPRDADAGERARAAGDLPALRRLAHSLKSVLLSLGLDADSALAAAIEQATAGGRADAAWTDWRRLHGRLLDLAGDGDAGRRPR